MKRACCFLSPLVFLLLSLNVFSEEGGPPCPGDPKTPSSTVSNPTEGGATNSSVSTPSAGGEGGTKENLGLTLDPSQQGSSNQTGLGGLGVGSHVGGDNKKPFGPSDFMTAMRAYLDHARAEIKAKEKELREKAALRKIERTIGLKSKQRQAEEAFNDLVNAHTRLGRVEVKVEKLKTELNKWEMKLEVERKVHGHSYYQKEVDEAQGKLNEVMPEYNSAKAQVDEASKNYHETHQVLEQAFKDMGEMEKELQDAKRASIPKIEGP